MDGISKIGQLKRKQVKVKLIINHIRKVEDGCYHPEVERNPLVPQMAGSGKRLQLVFWWTNYLP